MKWKKIDSRTLQNPPSMLDYQADQCFYARELISEGFDRSPDNQMIWNLKKPVTKRVMPEWRYKEEAIRRFAKELNPVFHGDRKYALAFIPPSRAKSDASYDSRMEDVIMELQKINERITYHEPVIARSSVTPSHQGGSRLISDLVANYRWTGFQGEEPEDLIVIDDVITSGAHFKAYQEVLRRHCGCRVYGFFWALTRKQADVSGEDL